ncbi:MAG TPA: IgGFc-binding protein [Polyangiaceae bacterium]|jgi:hypothetical protein|nr:IgGFc-binding protein [Polyangiaceae bacterium]HNZ21881.1 IgGFc-binding protein [Polyangiaceae bacterium]HOD24706.1 IgGFc-binding protein [Polyangiaceae bacterium]HOE51951.1 IgGFc-binding protein [Polyangiaceae bacterium]HOH03631.1 IgGFc-binding protein [Polyangiaceae bacterium]
MMTCREGDLQCSLVLEVCVSNGAGGTRWTVLDDCKAQGKVCAPSLLACAHCFPDERICDGQQVLVCTSDGTKRVVIDDCEGKRGVACRSGACTDLCAEAAVKQSNVGCEYWGVDLDNANINATSNAAAQQYAIVVSNPQPDLSAEVTIEQDDGPVGSPNDPMVVSSATIYPGNLRVFKLGPREVDGSPPGQFDTGPGTAHTRAAYRVLSSVPVVAYQFNPLDNVNVFSNDASLLKPVEAVTYTPGLLDLQYIGLGWPQTIAHTDDPETNFNPANPTNLRAFLTVVGTQPDTRVRIAPSTVVVAGMGIEQTRPGQYIEAVLQPFEVLNLETGDFNADFTGTLVEADGPVLAFSGSEASDAPYFDRLANRFCCADHLEEQLDPLRTAGTSFFAAHAPNRSAAVSQAGASLLGVVPEPEFFRILSVADRPVHIQTTLPEPDDKLELPGRGAYLDLIAYRDFHIDADGPIMLASVQASQDAAGVRRGLPGGDPSLLIIPPIEQYRANYVFLTPDKYAFDFVVIVASTEALVTLDGQDVMEAGCARAAADGLTDQERGSSHSPAWVYRCQLSFPVVLPDAEAPNNVLPGIQNDGVHRIEASMPVLALVYGFDNYVSYAYAAGTQLSVINLK